MVADVTRVGEWSPVCTACWWDEGDGPHIGGKFTGRNERPERTWETHSEEITADPGREFAWVVAEPPTRALDGATHSSPWTAGPRSPKPGSYLPRAQPFSRRSSVTMQRRRLPCAATRRKTVLERPWLPSRV